MAFATLEDLEDKVDLVFFPNTWHAVRDQVRVDQVVLVSGTVQLKEEQANLIVEKVFTRLEEVQPAEVGQESFFSAPASIGEPAPVQELARNGTPAPASRPGQPLRDQRHEAIPPPPPNFEEVWEDDDTNRPDNGEPAATPHSPFPTPHPESAFLTTEQTVLTKGGKEVTVPGNGRGHGRTIVVEIMAVSSWRDTCRRTLQTARTYSGEDLLQLRIPDRGLIMDFPDIGTQHSSELIEALEHIPGIIRVYSA
jgi:hypothetical protein